MEEEKAKQIKWLVAGIIVILVIAGSAIVILNNKNVIRNTSLPSMDPETGIQIWITAVNTRDYPRLYSLAPDSMRQQLDEATFTQAQEGNPLLRSGNKITGYQVLNQTLVGNNATITAQLILETTGEGNGNLTQKIPLYIKFLETFEHGEWKVWTAEPG
jgi:hypothetical protein